MAIHNPKLITCPIWGTQGSALDGYEHRDGTGIDSPRAGGAYFITRSAALSLKSVDDDTKVKLTHEIVSYNRLGSVLEISSNTLLAMDRVRASRPSERAARLLDYLVRESRYLGQNISFAMETQTWNTPSVLGFSFVAGPGHDPMFAWSDSLETEELVFLMRMLASDNLIELGTQHPIPDVIVQPLGYERALGEAERDQSDQAFIAMWFDRSLNEAYSSAIEPAVRGAGYRPLRIDQKEHVNRIDDEIIAEIKRSRFLVADFTSLPGCPRGGVYFEAGYAFALGKPVIWTCRSDLIGEVHFDTRQFNHIVWREPADLQTALKNRIGAVVGDGPLLKS